MRLLGVLLVCWGMVFSGWAVPEEVAVRSALLRERLKEADDAYYERGAPILSDAEYDALRAEYAALRGAFPELPDYDGVGAEVSEGKRSGVHSRPMLSLKKAYSDGEVLGFVERCGSNEVYCVEPKVDGFSLVLRYEAGRLVRALTRGDGTVGVDVTEQVMASGCAPLVLGTNAPRVLEVRGEAFLSFAAFEALNDRRESEGQNALKSPRNSAVGTMRLKDLVEVARRDLSFCVFEVVSGLEEGSHEDRLARVERYGLAVVPCRKVSGNDVLKTVERMNTERAGLGFATDGVVIRVDDLERFAELGSTARWPRGAVARKYRSASVETRLVGVEWRLGESGRWTPVACFERVVLDGAELERASLHSVEHLRAMDLRLGDRIWVTRSGGVIPVVLGRVPGERTGDEQIVEGPPEVRGDAL